MTKIDDLSVGMYIAISQQVDGDEERHSPFEFGFFTMRQTRTTVQVGLPLKVLAIALPFACVTDGKNKFSLDLRTVAVQRVDKKYFEAMTDPGEPINGVRRRRKKRDKPDPMKCAWCGAKCVQRLIKPGEGVWGLFCKRCGRDGPMPPVPS